MKDSKRIVLTIIWLVLGIVLLLCGILEIADPFWSGMGGGLLAVGILQMIRHIRYKKDEVYREAVDTKNRDERNHFLSGKAWAWTGYLFVILNGVAVIGLKVAGFDTLSTWASFQICGILILYWLSYLFLKKKY